MYLLGISGAIGHGKTSFADAFDKLEPTAKHFESSEIIAELANAWQATLPKALDAKDLIAINDWVKELPPLIFKQYGIEASFGQLCFNAKDVKNRPNDYAKLFEYLSLVKLNPELAKQTINTKNKGEYRSLLQWLGGYLPAKVDKGIWYNQILHRAKIAQQAGCELATAGGVRYLSDADIIRQGGGKIVFIVRPALVELDLQDPTEAERQQIMPDTRVINNGSLLELENCAKRLFEDLRSNNLRSEYRAI